METLRERVRHIYHFDHLDRVPDGALSAAITPRSPLPGTPAAVGAVVKGERVRVALVRMARGTGSPLATHATEQFHYVLEGTLVVDIDGRVLHAPAGHVVHVPAGMPHGHAAGADGDAVYYAVTDARSTDAGTPVDGGAGSQAAPRTRNTSGRRVQYVYDIATLNAVPEGPASAQVIPRNFISGKSSSFGAALRGDKLQVGHIHKGVGSGTKLHTHPNEQFSLVLDGTMIYEIDGATLEPPPRSVTHLPPGIRHSAIASAAGDVLTFVAKDTSHGMSGPPVDGIEDGPVYLPGFGPKR